MHSILIAHRDVAYAEKVAADLGASGYFTLINCPGPWPPLRCIRCDTGYCPLTEGADLMIYDPMLSSVDGEGRARRLAVESALAHPDVPILLAWSPNAIPDASVLRAIRAQAPRVRIAARDPAALRSQVNMLLGDPDPRFEVMT
ncbi:MAG TPA: hypothetical protein VF937_09870 [Chloroflexota bacterium]